MKQLKFTLFAMFCFINSFMSKAQNGNCDSVMLNQSSIALHDFNDTSNLVLFYRSNGITILVPKRQILLKQNELQMNEQTIQQRITFIETKKLRASTKDFKFTDKAFYMARRLMDTGKCIVYYNNREMRNVKKMNYKDRNCIQYVKYEFEPGVYFKNALHN